MLQLVKDTHIDFIGKRRIFYFISILLLVLGLSAIFRSGEAAWGIDFTGGMIQEYKFDKPVPVEEIRKVMLEGGVPQASIQQFKDSPNVYLIKTQEQEGQDITANLSAAFPERKIDLLRVESVGPVAGKYLRRKASLALIWALFGILIYISLRFKHFEFALAGIIALIHDCLITLGFMGLTGRQIDLVTVTAILTIAGYSINDTIVIYDRVRENTKNLPKLNIIDLINLSVNQTLGRTLLTTFTTLMVVLALLFWGGQILSNFAFALLVGFITGTYSTIFIASPLVLLTTKLKKS